MARAYHELKDDKRDDGLAGDSKRELTEGTSTMLARSQTDCLTVKVIDALLTCFLSTPVYAISRGRALEPSQVPWRSQYLRLD